jgi:hypothetical protein
VPPDPAETVNLKPLRSAHPTFGVQQPSDSRVGETDAGSWVLARSHRDRNLEVSRDVSHVTNNNRGAMSLLAVVTWKTKTTSKQPQLHQRAYSK